jgi:Holliday junction resolvase-like predicted endonuclease
VKTRRSVEADATESVTPAKRRQLVALAEAYLSANAVPDTVPCRFDVVAVTLDSRGAPPAVTLFRDAFSPEG